MNNYEKNIGIDFGGSYAYAYGLSAGGGLGKTYG